MIIQFSQATRAHFVEIANLVSSREELYLVHPSGHYPWDIAQLTVLSQEREALTVGLCDGKVVAFANLYSIKQDESAFIGNVIVSDTYQGQGIGKALVEHMMVLCRSQYGAVAHISVFGFNAPAMLLYANLGFVPYTVEPRRHLNGKKVALIHMRHTE